jgi:hypothetical protein
MATLRAIYMDLANELGDQGFRWIFLIHNHGAPNNHKALNRASDYFHDVYGGAMVHLFGLKPVFSEWRVYPPGTTTPTTGSKPYCGEQTSAAGRHRNLKH